MNNLAKIRYGCLEREVPYDKEITISFNNSERLIIKEIWIRQYLNSRFNNSKFRKKSNSVLTGHHFLNSLV